MRDSADWNRPLARSVVRAARVALPLVMAGGSTFGGPVRPAWQRDRAALDRRFVCEEFRIHYSLQGTHALPESASIDAQEAGSPVRIQDLAIQLLTARRCYVEVLGLRHPFESPRYKGRVRFVDVNVWALPGLNGTAGDAVVNYHRDNDPPEGCDVLTIDLSNRLSPANLSPAHELFHLFQNGYTQFKTPWYYEGVARWSEDLLRQGRGAAGSLPATAADLEHLFELSYGASMFWEAMARQTDPVASVRMPDHWRALHYPSSGRPVVEDLVFSGAPFLKTLLEELDEQDDLASRRFGLDAGNWPEDRQRSPDNNPYLWAAVIAACGRHGQAATALRELPSSGRPP